MKRLIIISVLLSLVGCSSTLQVKHLQEEVTAWKARYKSVEDELGAATLTRDALIKENEKLRSKLPPSKHGRGIRTGGHHEWTLIEVEEKLEDGNLPALFEPPKIDGSVVGVSSRVNLLVIDVGENDGVCIGFEFTIKRKGNAIGKLVVEKVYPRQAACRVILDQTKGKVRKGDKVNTTVY
jgi:hypothetical protein